MDSKDLNHPPNYLEAHKLLNSHTSPTDEKEPMTPDQSTGSMSKSPSFKENDDSVKNLLVYYAQNSTMHGVPSIVGSEIYRGRHYFWISVVAIMGLFLGTVIYWQMSDYYDYPTLTSVNIAYVDENDFPAISVCDLNMFQYLPIQQYLDNYTAYHLTKLTEITGLYHRYSKKYYNKIPEPKPRPNTTSVELIENMMSKLLAIMSNPRMNPLFCSWGDHYWTNCPCTSVKVTDMGICMTIDVAKMAKEKSHNKTKSGLPAVGNAMRGLTFYLDTFPQDIPYRFYQYDGFKIVLHNRNEEPLPKSSGFVIQANTSVEVEISKNVKIGLPPPYKAFGSGSCVDTKSSSFKNPLKRFANYSKEICEAECFIDFVIKTCGGCRHFLHPGNESICPIEHLADCYRQSEGNYYGGHSGHGDQNSGSHEAERNSCYCPMPCHDAKYAAAVTSAPFKYTDFFVNLQDKYSTRGRLSFSLSYIHFYFADPVVTTIEQVPVYSTEGLLGSIGGQVGLFMGFSLVTVAEMLELLFILATRSKRGEVHKNRHAQLEMAART